MTEKDNMIRIELNGKKYIIVRKKMRYDALMNPDPQKSGEWLKLVGQGQLIVDDNVYLALLKLLMGYDDQREVMTI